MSTYNPNSGEEEVNHREPKEILKEIDKIDNELQKTKEDLAKKLKEP